MTDALDDLQSELLNRAHARTRGVTGGKTWPKDNDGGKHAYGRLGAGAGGSVASTMPTAMTWPGGSKDAKPPAIAPHVNEPRRGAAGAK